MNIWMSFSQEAKQGYKGLWAHVLVGCLAVTLADRFGGSPHWAAIATLTAGMAWEILGHVFTHGRWIASGLGFLAFGAGATIGLCICIFS